MRSFLALFIFVGCASQSPPTRPALINQILRPRPGYEGRLTNQFCKAYKDGKCTDKDVVEYDIRLQEVRDRLLTARFVCVVGNKRFRVCHELHGLCHQTEVTTGSWPFRKKEIKLLEVLDIEKNYQTLIDLNTVCASMDSDVGREFFED